jgi:REP element-mobilizing transposase RayT
VSVPTTVIRVAVILAMPSIITEYPQFFTATNLEWRSLLQSDKYKDIVVDSLRFIVNNKRAIIYGFVLMQNHIHIIWQMQAGVKRQNVQRDFLNHTAQKMQEDMIRHKSKDLSGYFVNAKDRKYQFWERNSLSVDLWSEKVLTQKLRYIHQNPVRAGLCQFPEQYKYSSALLYKTGIDNWGFLTHYRG